MEEGFVSKKGGFVIANKECGDHGVRWRLAYSLNSPHKLIETGNSIREWAYQLQGSYELELATPLTHNVKKETLDTSG